METAVEETAIIAKTRELCEMILQQPEYKSIRRDIDTFMANEAAKTAYQELNEQGEYLHHKQHQGLALTEAEVAGFESLRSKFFSNPVAKNFAEAQQQMQKIQETVGQYVNKTFELGRVPDASDFESGSCGSGCGCHH